MVDVSCVIGPAPTATVASSSRAGEGAGDVLGKEASSNDGMRIGKVKIMFNGDFTCDGQDHRNCRGPLANDVFEEILGSQTAGLDESKSSESQVTMKHDLPVHETFK